MMARVASAVLLLSCAGCFQIDLYAPHGMDVYLMSEKKPAEVHRQWRTWFVVWGLVPQGERMPDEMIDREKLTEVRVITVDTVPDAGIGLLYNVLIPIGLCTQSMVIEGNRGPVNSATAATRPVEHAGGSP
jgi:hypothetical protein